MYTGPSWMAPHRHATEMAVLSSVSHPNIVQAYACLPDMTRLEDGPAPAACEHSGPAAAWTLRFGALLLGVDEDPSQAHAPCDVLVTELCDLGDLRDALRGWLGAAVAGWPQGAPLVAELLCDAAAALLHLHDLRLAHGGVSADHVYLKSDPSSKLGCRAKLGGFGRASILNPDGPAAAGCGCCGRRCAAARDGPGGQAGGAPDGPAEEGPAERHPSDCESCRSGRLQDAPRGPPGTEGDVSAFGALILEAAGALPAPPDGADGAADNAAGPPGALRALRGLALDCLRGGPEGRPPMERVLARLDRIAGGAPRGGARTPQQLAPGACVTRPAANDHGLRPCPGLRRAPVPSTGRAAAPPRCRVAAGHCFTLQRG